MSLTVTPAAAVASTTTSATTTASFTPAVGETLLVLATGGASSSVAVTLAITDTQSGSWTTQILSNLTSPGGAGGAATGIYTRTVASATAMTVTVTASGGVPNATGLRVYRLSAAGTVTFGTPTRNSASGASITPAALTSVTASSTLFATVSEWSGGLTLTSSDLTLSPWSNANMEGAHGFKSLGSPGAQTFQLSDGGGGGQWYWAAIEVWDSGGGGGGGGALTVTSATAVVSATGSPVTTGSFTPAVGESLVALVAGGASGTASVSYALTDTQGGIWTPQILANLTSPGGSGGGGAAAIFTRDVTSATSMTITVTASGGTPNALGVQVYRLAGGTVQFGPTGKGAPSGASITPTALTSVTSGSTLFVATSEWRGGLALTSSDLAFTSFSNVFQEGGFGYKTLGSPGPATFQQTVSGGGGLWYFAALEAWAVTGTATGGMSTAAGVPMQGPLAFDSITVEAEFTPGSWTDLSNRLRLPLAIRQGRSTPFGDIDPANSTIELENPDGWLTPGNGWSPYPNVGKGIRLRVKVSKAGKTYTRLVGTAQSWEIVLPDGSTNTMRAVVKVYDSLTRLGRRSLRSNWTERALVAARNAGAKVDAWEAAGTATGLSAYMTNYSPNASKAGPSAAFNGQTTPLSFTTDHDAEIGEVVVCNPDSTGFSCSTMPGVQVGAKTIYMLVKTPTSVVTASTNVYLASLQDITSLTFAEIAMRGNGSGNDLHIFDRLAATDYGTVLANAPLGQWLLLSFKQNGGTASHTDVTYQHVMTGATATLSNINIDVRLVAAVQFPAAITPFMASSFGGLVAMSSLTSLDYNDARPDGAQGTLYARLGDLIDTCAGLSLSFTRVGALTDSVLTGSWSGRDALAVAREMMRSNGGYVWARPRDSEIMLIGSDVTYPASRLLIADIDGDIMGPPAFQDTQDTKPTRVEAQYPGGSAVAIDTAAEALGDSRTATITTVLGTGMAGNAALAATLLAREANGLRVNSVTLDLTTAVTDWTDVLFDESTTLGGLYPTQRIGISSYPEFFGRSVMDQFVQGWTETYAANNRAWIAFDLSSAGDAVPRPQAIRAPVLGPAIVGGYNRVRTPPPRPIVVSMPRGAMP